MRKNSVAVLDIRSSEICAAVAEKGVNGTFVFKSKYSCEYDGYAEGELLDMESFVSAVGSVVESTFSALGRTFQEFYIGIPGEFLKCEQSDKTIGFTSSKRINAKRVEELIAVAAPEEEDGWTVIKSSPLYFTLSDGRMTVNPVGEVSDGLRGRLCYFKCRTAFQECVEHAFKKFADVQVFHWVPQVLSQALYLVDSADRDACAVLLDLGYISSTYSVILGNGVIFSESFSVGIGHIAYLVSEELNIPYEVALGFVKSVNLNARERLSTVEEYRLDGKLYSFKTSELRTVIREGLDGLCETIEECREAYTGRDVSDKPLFVTGECALSLRGAAEHISARLLSEVEVIAPKVPYYDKPIYSSLLSLLSAALS